jgi:hypothetical protein
MIQKRIINHDEGRTFSSCETQMIQKRIINHDEGRTTFSSYENPNDPKTNSTMKEEQRSLVVKPK